MSECAGASSMACMAALCTIARFHQIPADPATLVHQLGLSSGDPFTADDLLHAAQHLGLKAKRSRSTPERLALTPLPALALMRSDDASLRVVILAQCDGQRVLFQDVGSDNASSRPTIESLDVFTPQWTGELILITSRATLAGALAKFDFSWFIPALVKYRKLLGEILLISFMLQLFGLVSPLFFQVVMDKVLVNKGMTTLDVLVIGLVIVVVFESVLNALRAYVFSHTTSRIDVELGSRLRLLGSDTNFSAMHCIAPSGSAYGCEKLGSDPKNLKPAAWVTRWPACASWRTSAAFSPATP